MICDEKKQDHITTLVLCEYALDTFTREGRIADEHRLASFWNLSSKPAVHNKRHQIK